MSWRRSAWLGLEGLVAAVACALVPSPAAAQGCPSTDASYTGNCGPMFNAPSWTDAGGWNDPSQYSTIQLADVNGDGRDELFGRSDAGIQIYRFDTSLGQWRPQVDASGVPQLLKDFASFMPSDASDPHNPNQAKFFSTIQAADIDGLPGAEILGRFWDGIRIYKYQPSQGNGIDGGSWTQIRSTAAPFSDSAGWGDPSLYLTIKAADTDGDGQAELLSRTSTGAAVYRWKSAAWRANGPQVTNSLFGGDCADVHCYSAFRPFGAFTARLTGVNYLLTRPGDGAPANQQGAQLLKVANGGWTGSLATPQSPQDPDAAPFNSQSGWPDCAAGGGECFDQSPSYYETLETADIDGVPGDELVGRLTDGLRVKRYGNGGSPVVTDDAALTYQDCSSCPTPYWTHATGVPGAIGGTESSAASYATATWQGGAGVQLVQVIGPKGPGLGTLQLSINPGDGSNSTVTIGQAAPSRIEQQVLYTFASPAGSPTIQFSSIQGGMIDAVRTFSFAETGWSSLSTLSDLAGTSEQWAATPGTWGSIRTGNLDGQGGDEVLALDGTGLQAWSYNSAADAWKKLQPTTPLALAADPWLTHPEYYSTLRTGDVDGDGRDDVVARGPYGIRTWFYNRRGTGGWEGYQATGPFTPAAGQQWVDQCKCYPAFSGAQVSAYDALNSAYQKALGRTGTIRDVWTLENKPSTGFSQTLLPDLASPSIGNCSNQQLPLEPPRYASCTPPANSSGFTASDWTAVVNELLAEAYNADQVVGFFDNLQALNAQLFLQETGELDSLASKLSLQSAAGTNTTFDPLPFVAGGLGIAASVAGLVPGPGTAVSAFLWVASEIVSMVPQTSPTVTDGGFSTSLDGVKVQFATIVSETTTGVNAMSQQARQDPGLTALIGQMRTAGGTPWADEHLDSVGIESAANQAFVQWVYKTLVPTIASRYSITDCIDHYQEIGDCDGPTPTTGVIGGKPNFTMAGQWFAQDKAPCSYTTIDGWWYTCIYYKLADDLRAAIWNPLPATCLYTPGSSASSWKFGCPAGDDIALSIGQNTWGFNNYCGDFVASSCAGAGATASAATAQTREPITLGRKRHGRARAVPGRMRLSATITLARDVQLTDATVKVPRLLFEPRGRGELTRGRRSRPPGPLVLRRTGPGRFSAASTSGGQRVRITLRRRPYGRASLSLTATARAFRTPGACHALPASVALESAPLWLHTRLVLDDGRVRQPIVLRHHVRCLRDARGNVDRLRYVRHRSPKMRAGLAVTARGPGSVRPGERVRYDARVRNRRRTGERMKSSLWHITVGAGPRTKQIRELRRGRTRTVALTVRVPRDAGTARVPGSPRGRFCIRVAAVAPGARGTSDRVCARVQR